MEGLCETLSQTVSEQIKQKCVLSSWEEQYQNLCVLHDEKQSVFHFNCKMWRTKNNNCILQYKCYITKNDQIVSVTSTIMRTHIILQQFQM